ncbi:flagellum-specific ATP synthase [Roseateles sp. YR242]|uniref:FliI/YscN family ATPase n=1 Tax=Roseateles sp. YR242 TaxID=1855305 RepID=UPI0008BA0193|nr:FliI/YscN family ATPase [Roseateles sp. YR242]SEK92999.1 flagellum-specific ATP synthase [Roseateles sp. YR242]
MALTQALTVATRSADLLTRTGVIQQLSGLMIEASGPDAVMGEVCSIAVRGRSEPLLAEVVGMRAGRVLLMPYGASEGLAPGCVVTATGETPSIAVGDALLGRVIDGFGQALDGGADPWTVERRPVRARPINPMHRPRITEVMETGVRAIDTLLTLGKGQRVGIFAGSGVGKSTLLGMIARHVRADINVIALIGERGREVREFIDKQLGPEGLARSVVVVATSDQPALARLRAAHAAVTVAEFFRDRGQQVLLTMDSVTRFAMARREVGLSAGEPPTARGYTPSVFAELPELCERCGTTASGGSITALLTVLVEGDDLNEPITDCLRATLDGHVVLSRQLANRGQYPAVDALKSVSRLMPDLVPADVQALAVQAVELLALLDRNRQLVDIGAYERGTNAALDKALDLEAHLIAFLRQIDGGVPRDEAVRRLSTLMKGQP